MRNYDFYKTDCETILSQIKLQEKQLKLKRRWLIGLDTVVESKEKQPKCTDFLSTGGSLPESLLREDDIFCETIKACISKAFIAGEEEKRHRLQVNMSSSDIASIRKVLFSCLNALTNKGLYLLATILAQGSFNCEKTPPKMKQFIKASLPKVVGTDVFKQLSQLLNDSQNFRDNSGSFVTPASQSLQDAAARVLDGLEDLPKETLVAMKRKLAGVQGSVPQFPAKKCGWNRDDLVKRVRNTCEGMLSELNAGDKLQEPLAKALSVAALSLKLTPGYQNSSVEFHHFSPEIHALQDEIGKALQLLKRGRFDGLEIFQPILEPHAKVSKDVEVSNRSLRTAIKKWLTEYLFECSDMDAIPKSLLENLADINKNSQNKPSKCYREEKTEQEVECILNMSAQTKQIVLDLLTECGLDKDFADAYMEDLVESDDDDDDEGADGQQQGHRNFPSGSMSHSIDFSFSGESIGESKPNPHDMSTSSTNRNGSSFLTPRKQLNVCKTEKIEAEYFTDVESVGPYNIGSSSLWEESMGKSSMFQTNPNLMTATGRVFESSIKRCKLEYDTDIDPASTPNVRFSNLSCSEAKTTLIDQHANRNRYLAIQEMCDVTSITAYNLIGHMMKVFAQKEGIDLDCTDTLYLKGRYLIEEDYQVSIEENQASSREDVGSDIAQIVGKLTPPLSKSGIEKLKELMRL